MSDTTFFVIPVKAFEAPDVEDLTAGQRFAIAAVAEILEEALPAFVRALSNAIAQDKRLVECLELYARMELAKDGSDWWPDDV